MAQIYKNCKSCKKLIMLRRGAPPMVYCVDCIIDSLGDADATRS